MEIPDDLRTLAAGDGRYEPEAYQLVLEVLAATVRLVKEGRIKNAAPYASDRSGGKGESFHISGQELLEGFRLHILDQYGNMSLMLLERWGVRSSRDVGELVFRMVETGRMARREGDTRADFQDGYDFSEVFGGDQTMGD